MEKVEEIQLEEKAAAHFKEYKSCFASSSHRAWNHIFKKLLPWCPGQSPKMKRVKDRSCCLFSKHGEDLCTKSEQSKENASALTTTAVTTSHHTGNWPGAPELKTQPYSWTYKSCALKGCNRLASLEVRHRGKHVKTPWSQGYIIIKNSEILLLQFPWVK